MKSHTNVNATVRECRPAACRLQIVTDTEKYIIIFNPREQHTYESVFIIYFANTQTYFSNRNNKKRFLFLLKDS